MSPVAAAEDSEPGSGVQSGTLATPHDSRPMTPSHGDAVSGAATPLSPMTPMTPMSPVGLR